MRDTLLERGTPPPEEPQVGPLGGVPEDIVIIGADSSMHITVPEDLPVRQDVKVRDSGFDEPDPLKPGLMCVFVS